MNRLLLVGSLLLLTATFGRGVTNVDENAVNVDFDMEAAESYVVPTFDNDVNFTRRSVPYYQGYNPWDVTPGTYNKEAYGGHIVGYGPRYGYYNPRSIYARYLSHPAYNLYTRNCKSAYKGSLYISKEDLYAAFGAAIHYLNLYKRRELSNYRKGNYIKSPYTSAAARSQVPSYINRRSPKYQKEMSALFMEEVSRYLAKYHCLNNLQANLVLPKIRINAVVKTGYVDQKCQYSYGAITPPWELCSSYTKGPWRTIDGTCNNPKFKYWGRSNVCHLSLLPKAYPDGISAPKEISVTGYPLPSPRALSNYVHHPFNARAFYTNMKMQWGQWINHDITHTPQIQASYNGLIDCCHGAKHPACLPILLGKGDYLAKYGRTCMNFVRSTPCPLCVAGPRQQMNSVTSYLDGSDIYGSTVEEEKQIRSYSYGLLRSARDAIGAEILPHTNSPWADQCKGPSPCHRAGDARVSQHPSLTAMHTLWARQHNRLARILYKLYPKWSDELIYQVVRKIVIGQLQYITYKEYFPIVLGKQLMEFYDLTDRGYGYTKYNIYTDPTSWNEYAAAACRFGHSQIPNWFSINVKGSRYSNNYTAKGYYLRNSYFDPHYTNMGLTDGLLKGLCDDRSMLSDVWIEDDVRNYLYRHGKNPGLDLAAINIQRGRDHGLPGYIYYINYCFNVVIYDWKDLEKFIPYQTLAILKKLYKSVSDIDLFVGGLSEKKVPDGDIGPTFSCINGIQWHHTKFGDRFFYSHEGVFSPNQLKNLRQTTLASVICLNTRIDKLQKWAFFPYSRSNPWIDCSRVPDIQLGLYADAIRYAPAPYKSLPRKY